VTAAEVGKVADTEVGKVADTEVGKVADTEVGKVAEAEVGKVAEAEVDKMAEAEVGKVTPVRRGAAVRKATLVAHVAASVGWLGAVTTSLVLAGGALGAGDPGLVRAACLVLEPLGWAALVPFSIASLATGLLQGLLSPWGVAGHYWVLAKLVMNVLAVAVLLLYMRTLGALADLARAAGGDVTPLRTPSPAVHAAAAMVLLLVALVLSVYKPRGRTGFTRRPAPATRPASADA
jgi:hypothetical protein